MTKEIRLAIQSINFGKTHRLKKETAELGVTIQTRKIDDLVRFRAAGSACYYGNIDPARVATDFSKFVRSRL